MRVIVAVFLILGAVLIAAGPAGAGGLGQVGVENGRILLIEPDGPRRFLTESGRDSAPFRSHDGKAVVFLRATGQPNLDAGSGAVEANEIWSVDSAGRQSRRLVRAHADADLKKFLGGLQSPQFSPDGRLVYFLSAAWATSGAVHQVEVASGRIDYIAPGNSLEVIQAGKHRGALIVNQHRYFLGSGSFDWYWLLTPEGKDLGPIGEDVTDFRELYQTGRSDY